MPTLAKRACDTCIARKVRCDGALPCATCEASTRKVQCTYVRPAQKRGPKARRPSIQKALSYGMPPQVTHETKTPALLQDVSDSIQVGVQVGAQPAVLPPHTPAFQFPLVLVDTISKVIREYENNSYSVWPVIRSDVLAQQLALLPSDESTFCLATALCAATIAQLNIPPLESQGYGEAVLVDSSYLSRECIRIREQCDFREHLDVRWVLTSFFLHVYHAKVNKRNSALMYIQEAVSSAKLLGLDKDDQALQGPAAEVVDNREILFSLLWVSERGYSIHLGLTPSFSDRLIVKVVNDAVANTHVYGLVELSKLFAVFDQCTGADISENLLVESEKALQVLEISADKTTTTRLADHSITREWMRIIIWQRALSAGYLSSLSPSTLMDFTFPIAVSHDLLAALRNFSSEDLLPLGRDQLLKCFEIANVLADTLLCSSVFADNTTLQCGPYELLHALYQKLHPFLYLDQTLDSILREKTGQAFLCAPSRLWNLDPPYASNEGEEAPTLQVISAVP
ncbi:putative sucrose utilization protein SUC1 [Talaromyces islandicus]|uniref:Putative sucrose utilization protein SUC1 n=1 Tax=Talaromyces islandicus TaxID=28573 RepID=A0A0U1LM40_TALIS|nr:putative sucrose utilization protein SUC1 [Talaromyces islandicus]